MGSEDKRKVTLGDYARELAASMAHARMGALSKMYLDRFIRSGDQTFVHFHTPTDEEVAECVRRLADVFTAGVDAALSRVRAQREHATDAEIGVLNSLMDTIEDLRKEHAPEPPK